MNYSRAKILHYHTILSAEARIRNIPEIHNEEIESNVAATLTDSNEYNLNGNKSYLQPTTQYIYKYLFFQMDND